MKELLVVSGCLGAITLMAAYVVLSSILSGWALTHLWRWFVVPVFNVAELTIVQAIGLGVVVSYLTYHQTEAKDDRSDADKVSALIVASLRPIISVAVGWIVYQFV